MKKTTSKEMVLNRTTIIEINKRNAIEYYWVGFWFVFGGITGMMTLLWIMSMLNLLFKNIKWS